MKNLCHLPQREVLFYNKRMKKTKGNQLTLVHLIMAFNILLHYYYYNHFTPPGLCQDYPGKPVPER